jgi:dTMP kinase
LFITFEGIEGCGKSTQIERLEKRLLNHGISLIKTLEPGGTRTGKKIRQMLLDSRNNDLAPLTELILYTADRAQHVEEVIKPALEEGKWIICDRYFDATKAYQGFARGQDLELINLLNDKATNGINPDVTFLLECPVEIGLNRALKRNRELSLESQDRFEKEKMEFHQKVRDGYLELARKDKKRFVIIDASLSEDAVEAAIFQAIRSFIPT